jgi:hypothetical protein
MRTNQRLSETKIFYRASSRQRVKAGIVFLVVAASFGVLWLAAHRKIEIGRWLGVCGFKQRYGLPCPTCGMTTSALVFVRGKIFKSFHIQPAAALLCCVLVLVGFLAFITVVFGVYFDFIKRFFEEVKIKHIVLVLIFIIAAAWAVTLARALAANNQG